jgi:hypothetical protein
MFTGITSYTGALVTAVGILTGAATMGGGAVAADPSQDDQFLALLDKEEIPAVENVPSVIAAGHKVCRRLDGGMPVDDMLDAMRNDVYAINPRMRLHRARVTTTVTRFITAAVETYCPYDQGKIASIAANPAPGPGEPTHPVAVYTAGRYRDDWSHYDARGTVLASSIEAAPAGEITPSNPPQIPAPPPPTAHIRTPPRVNAAPPPPEQPPPLPPEEKLPPPEEQPPPSPPEEKLPPPPEQALPPSPEQAPPPQQVEPPASPQPGSAGGSSSNGGGAPAEPSRPPRMPPGFVRLAP